MFPFNITNPGILIGNLPTSQEAAFLTTITSLAYQSGDILYHNGTTITRLPKGTDGEVLTLVAGIPSWEPSAGGHVIEDEGTPLTQRATLNFVGAGVTVTDSGTKTVVTIPGGGTSYTDEEAQDAVGTILTDSSEIDFTYNDATPSITASIVAGSIDETKLDASVNASLDLADSASQPGHTHTAVNITDFTEAAQDAVGAMVDTTLVYVDATPLLTRAALTGAITASQGSNTTALGSFTKAQLDAAVSDGNVLYVGDITQYTDELAQDAIGAMIDSTLVYTDLTPLLSRAALTGAITASAGSNTTSLGSFTKAQLDAAVSDGDVLYVGDVTTNATHTGEVTGSGALTVDKTAITNKTLVTAAVADHVLIADASDSDNLKKVTIQTIVDLASGGGNTYFNDIYIDQSGGTSDTYGALSGTINGSNALFTVSQSAYATGTLQVWLNGQLLTQGTGEDWVETTPASGTFTFNTAPATGSLITVAYQKVVTNSATVVTTTTVTELAQDAVGTILTDSAEIDFTYNDATPSITASIVAGSIDESKLDASVNASLDLADTAVQPAALTSLVTGPGSATDNGLVRFDSTTGKLVQEATVTASDVTGGIVTIATIGNNDLKLQTGNATTGSITIADGADADITFDTDGAGNYIFNGDLENILRLGDTEYTANASGISLSLAASDSYVIISDPGGSALDFVRSEQPGSAGTIGSIFFTAYDSANNLTTFATILGQSTDLTNTSEDGKIVFVLRTAGTNANELEITGAALYPTTNDGLALGLAANSFSDLFLASGGVVNFNNGDATITHSTGLLTSNVDVAVPDEAYGAGWNGSLEVPTKNAVYDEMETKQDASVISGNGVGYIRHGATASTARPTGFFSIIWVGSVEPTNATNDDQWLVTA